jgi:hypothetical protein
MPTSTDIVLCGFWQHAVAEVAGRFTVLPETAEPDHIRTVGRPNSGEGSRSPGGKINGYR